jgi:hypothetical protein
VWESKGMLYPGKQHCRERWYDNNDGYNALTLWLHFRVYY